MRTEQIIWVRDFLKNISKIYSLIEEGQDFLVLKNSKPVFRVTWVRNSQKNQILESEKIESKNIYFPENIYKKWAKIPQWWKIINKKNFLKKFEKLQFNSGEKDLSQQIDTILYGR